MQETARAESPTRTGIMSTRSLFISALPAPWRTSLSLRHAFRKQYRTARADRREDGTRIAGLSEVHYVVFATSGPDLSRERRCDTRRAHEEACFARGLDTHRFN